MSTARRHPYAESMPRPPGGAELTASPRAARDRLAATLDGPGAPCEQGGGGVGLLGVQQVGVQQGEPGRTGPSDGLAGPSDGLAGPPDGRPIRRRADTPDGSAPGYRGDTRERAARFRTRTGLGAAAALLVVAALTGGWLWWQSATGTPTVVPLGEVSALSEDEADAPGDPTGPAAPTAGDPAPDSILVHIAGAVVRPGVVELPAGSRLFEAIDAAGGGTSAAEPSRLNLAAVLADGQKVLVPAIGEPDPDNAPSAGSAGSATGTGSGGMMPGSGKINLNTAGVAELGTLPRVGPVLAQRIVDWRQQHGTFKNVEELDAVEGVGPKMLETLRPLVTV